MKKMKVLLVFALVVSMLLGMGISANAANDIKLVLDGKALVSDQAPRLESNYTLVPIRVISEALGGEVTYAAATQTVTITTVDHKLVLTVDSKTATVDGKSVTLDVPMRNFSGRTFVPARFVSESLGATVTYDASTRTVNIAYFSTMSGTIKIGGSSTVYPVSDKVATHLKSINSGFIPTVVLTDSGDGVKGAISGGYNVGNASRDLTAQEIADNPDLKSFKIGSDAIAVVVHKNSKVKNLTKQQVIDIFSGKIVDWADVGADKGAIIVQTRETGSGTLDGFTKLAMGTEKIVATAKPNKENGDMIVSVGSDINAIGFTSLAYVDETKVKAVSIDDIQCSFNNAFAGVWPYVRPLNVLTKGTPTGLTAKFLNFFRSPQGQKMMTDELYLPLYDKYLSK